MTGKRFKIVPEMEGRQAHWYARQRGSQSQVALCRDRAAELAATLPDGADVLEVAPGPGYFAVELARAGRGISVTGVDVSRTMVEIATAYAAERGVAATFRHGDVAQLPFADGTFDLVVCQAAFKNFAEPVRALDEVHRVLRPGGRAVIDDMSADATGADIRREVDGMGLSRVNAVFTRTALRFLRRRAYGRSAFEHTARASRFARADVTTTGLTLTATLAKS